MDGDVHGYFSLFTFNGKFRVLFESKTHLNWHFCQVTPFIKCSFMAEYVPERGSTLRLVRRLIENIAPSFTVWFFSSFQRSSLYLMAVYFSYAIL